MKYLTTLLLTLLVLGGCSNEVPSDQLVERGGLIYEVNSQTPFTGSSVDYRGEGQLWHREKYIDGKLNGLSEEYHSNGQLQFKENYVDGKSNGAREYYYENGQLKTKGNIKDGKFVGLVERYDENGKRTQ